jgi:hypothetical protein
MLKRLIDGNIDSPGLLGQINLHVPSRSLRNVYLLDPHPEDPRVDVPKFAFMPRAQSLCNELMKAEPRFDLFFDPITTIRELYAKK